MTAWLVGTLLSTALLIGLVLLIRRPIARWFGARAAYALWLAPLARLVVPPIPSGSEVLPGPVAVGSASYAVLRGAAEAHGVPVLAATGVIWLAGALICLAFHWLRHQRFIADVLASGWPLLVDGIGYDVVASRRVEGPMAAGLIHPLILVPLDFETRFTPAEQSLALLHEQLHHRRGDLWASAAALLMASLHWFNPLAQPALRAFRRDMEAACDAAVLQRAGSSTTHDYAQTIVRCAARPAPRSLCALTSIDELKGRLKMLNLKHGRLRQGAGLFLAGALAAAGMATAGAAEEKAGAETKEFVKKIEIRHMHGDKDALVKRDGGDEPLMEMNCPGEKFEAGSESGAGDKIEKIKFVVCTRKGESLLAALEKAEVDLQKRGEMPEQRKAEILGQIRAKITELRAKG